MIPPVNALDPLHRTYSRQITGALIDVDISGIKAWCCHRVRGWLMDYGSLRGWSLSDWRRLCDGSSCRQRRSLLPAARIGFCVVRI